MTRVVQVVHGFPPEIVGGTELYVERLAGALHERGHEVAVIAGAKATASPPSVSEDRHRGLPVHRIHRDDLFHERLDRGFCPPASRLLEATLGRLEPDLVHVQHWVRLTTNVVHVAWKLGIPAVVTLQDLWTSCARGFRVPPSGEFCTKDPLPENCLPCLGIDEPDRTSLAPAFRLRGLDLENEIRLARRVAVCSQAQARTLEAVISLPNDRLVVLPPSGLTELRRSPEPPPAPPFRIGLFGLVSEAKGQPLVLEALRTMRRKADVRVEILGAFADAQVEAHVRALAEGLDVAFHGPYAPRDLESLPLHLAVLPSRLPETYGFILDEAKALGLPVVASDSGAYGERVGAGGVLFRRGEAADLARVLDGLIEDPAALARLRGGVTPPEPFGRHVDAVERLYDEAIRSPRAETSAFDPLLHAEALFGLADHLQRKVLYLEEGECRAAPGS